ncbi:MAG: uroporphyrinogen-III synthase [Deltaproteobacteria bacterium]|nr:uroporphyrinogen-III synthase [Deltaproteobacteria bacterium]
MNNDKLKHKRILVTRPGEQAQEFVELLRAHGAEPILFPTIKIRPPRDWIKVDEALSKLRDYDTLIFTSVNGVNYFLQRLKDNGMNPNLLKNKRICAIGPKTAAQLATVCLSAPLIPEEYRAEAIVASLEKEGICGRRFLLPRAEEARDVLPQAIRDKGGEITVAPVYRTTTAVGYVKHIQKLFHDRAINVISFTSSSTVKSFMELLSEDNVPDLIKGCVVACIGPVTADTAASFGIISDITPRDYTIQGLTEAIVQYFTAAS